MDYTTTIYDTVYGGYTPNSAAVAIFPAVNLLVWTLSSILFRIFRGGIPLPVQVLLFASLMGTGAVAFFDIYGYTGHNLAVAAAVSALMLVASSISMASWRNATRAEVWSLKRRPAVLALRMMTIVPMSAILAVPVIASYYSLAASAIMDRSMDRSALEIRWDFAINGGFMSAGAIKRATKTITWYEPDDKAWQRTAWRLGSLDLGRILWNALHPDEKRPADFSPGTWAIAQIGFTSSSQNTTIGFPVICEYRDGALDNVRFLVGGSNNLAAIGGFDHITGLCPARFNPDGETLSDPHNIFPAPDVTISPIGEMI